MEHGIGRILKNLEDTITTTAANISEKGRAGEDKLNALSRLVNSYRRLFDLYRSNGENQEDASRFDPEDGDPTYVEALFESTAKTSTRKRLPRK